jgi:phage antirepressor YoqD-like protein
MTSLSLKIQNSTPFNPVLSVAVAPTAQTMSSREIAELTGKEHRHVKRDVEVMFEQLNIDSKGYAQTWTHPQNGQSYEEYALDKDLSVCLVSGYNVQLRMAIIKRWNELEAQQQFAVPTTFSQALLLAAQLEEQKEKLALQVVQQQQVIEVIQPKADVYDIISNSDNTYTIRVAAKLLKVRPKDLTDWLIANKWMYGRSAGTYRPSAQHDRNHLKLVASQYGTQVRVTGKGLVWIARKLNIELTTAEVED